MPQWKKTCQKCPKIALVLIFWSHKFAYSELVLRSISFWMVLKVAQTPPLYQQTIRNLFWFSTEVLSKEKLPLPPKSQKGPILRIFITSTTYIISSSFSLQGMSKSAFGVVRCLMCTLVEIQDGCQTACQITNIYSFAYSLFWSLLCLATRKWIRFWYW